MTDIVPPELYLVIGILGGLLVGYAGNELVFMSSRFMSRSNQTDSSLESGKNSSTFKSIRLWAFRKRYFAITVFLVPLVFAWSAFGIFSAFWLIWFQNTMLVGFGCKLPSRALIGICFFV